MYHVIQGADMLEKVDCVCYISDRQNEVMFHVDTNRKPLGVRDLGAFFWTNCHRLYRLATCKQSRQQCLLQRREKMKLCNSCRHPLSVVGLGGDNK